MNVSRYKSRNYTIRRAMCRTTAKDPPGIGEDHSQKNLQSAKIHEAKTAVEAKIVSKSRLLTLYIFPTSIPFYLLNVLQ